MRTALLEHLQSEIDQIKVDGLYKKERVITSSQDASIRVSTGEQVLNFCANNYLGLANHATLINAGKKTLDSHGFGVASVRFICGTQDIHKELEKRISEYLGTEDTILYSSCFDANGGLFETILGPEDAVISDELNHASIIDGIRLSKAKRFRYKNNNMKDLEDKLKEAADCRFRLIATDGVFSMDGIIANLAGIVELAEKYDAMIMVDDCHATGFVGPKGTGSFEHCGVKGKIDIITGTLGKALGGASGGFTSGKKEVIEVLRQRSRPYLFSNSLAPAIAGASIACLDMIEGGGERIQTLKDNAIHFRKEMTKAGFTLAGADHAIIPVMIGDAELASRFADQMLERGIYVVGFSFPVVPKAKARIRTQMSAAHTKEQLQQAIDAFIEVGKNLEVI
ncbi:MAG: glycine C-acetyltransferase [Bdellovibrionales bacterium]